MYISAQSNAAFASTTVSSAIGRSPARPVVLEAVESSSPKSDWNAPITALPLLPQHDPVESSTHLTPVNHESAPSLATDSLDHEPTPSLATEVTPDSSFLAQSTRTRFDLGLASDSPFNSDDFEGDAMSESSTDTHIVVPHPGSDEEDSAERRWRLAEQRGNDIRRARSVPSPRFQGTSSFLNVIVVCFSIFLRMLPVLCQVQLLLQQFQLFAIDCWHSTLSHGHMQM